MLTNGNQTKFSFFLPLVPAVTVCHSSFWRCFLRPPRSKNRLHPAWTEKNIDLLCTFLTDLDRHSSLTLSYFVSLSHIESCFSLAAFSSALVSINRGPHNSSMHHWPRWIILCLTDSTTCLTTIPLSHTDWACMMDYTMDYDGLYNRHSHTNTQTFFGFQPYQQTLSHSFVVECRVRWYLWPLIRADSVWCSPSLFHLFNKSCLFLTSSSGESRKRTQW